MANPAMVVRVLANIDDLKKAMAAGATQITTTTAAMQKLASSLDGSKLEQRAHNIVAAINQIGGATKLSDAEAKRLLPTLDAWIEKGQRIGKEIPPAILQTAEALRRVEEPTSRVNRFMGDLGTQVKATALGFISAQAVIGAVQTAFRAFTDFLGSSVQSFAEAELAQKKLTVALQASGQAAPGVVEHFNALSAEFQRTTTFSDDLLTQMQALLVEVGGVMPAEMKRALTAATDLASGLGIDLQQATMLVGKAFAGETGTLKRYGIVIDEAKLKAEGMPAVLDAIQRRFGGQAAAEVETYAGKIKQLANNWDDFKEVVGEAIVTDPIVAMILRQVAKEAGSATDATGGFSRGITAMLVELATGSRVTGDFVAILGNVQRAADDAAEATKRFSADAIRPVPSHVNAAEEAARKLREEKRRLAEELERATKAAAEHAKQIAALRESLSGQGAIKAAQDMVEALRGMPPVANLTREAQDRINDTVTKALEVYRALGKEAPASLRSLWAETVNVGKLAPEAVDGITGRWEHLGTIVMPMNVDALVAYGEALKKVGPLMSLVDFGKGKLPGDQIPITIPTPPPTFWQKILNAGDKSHPLYREAHRLGLGAADSIAQGILSGDWKSAVKDLGQKFAQFAGSAIAAGVDALVPGLGTMLEPIFGALVSKIGSLFKKESMKVNDLRDEFLLQFGPGGTGIGSGFHELAAQLHELGAAGDALFQRLLNAKKVQDFEAAMAAVNKALENSPSAMAAAAGYQTIDELQAVADRARKVYEFMRDSGRFSASAVEDAFKKATEAAIAAMDSASSAAYHEAMKARDAAQTTLDGINSQIKTLQNAVNAEAPEEYIGIVEQQQREQLRNLEEQRAKAQTTVDELNAQIEDAAAAAIAATTAAAEGAGQLTVDGIRDALDRAEFRVRVHLDTDGLPSGLSLPEPREFANGTNGFEYFDPRGELVRLHGWEKVTPLGAESSSGGNGDFTVRVPIYLENRQIGESIARVARGHVARG